MKDAIRTSNRWAFIKLFTQSTDALKTGYYHFQLQGQAFLDDFLEEQVSSIAKLTTMKTRISMGDFAVFLMDQELLRDWQNNKPLELIWLDFTIDAFLPVINHNLSVLTRFTIQTSGSEKIFRERYSTHTHKSDSCEHHPPDYWRWLTPHLYISIESIRSWKFMTPHVNIDVRKSND